MNANSLKWYDRGPLAQAIQAQRGALQGLLARAFDAWIHAAQRQPRAPETVRALHEKADRYEATQPGYAADLRFAARRSV